MRIVLAVIAALILSGCGLYAQQKQKEAYQSAVQMAKDSLAECELQHPAGSKKYMAKAKCQNDATALVKPFMPYPDLVDQDMANRMLFAERLEQGKITLAEANAQLMQSHSQVVAEEQRRQLSGRAVSAQESAAAAAWRSNAVTCTTFGNSTSCY